jgi:molybdopterin-guanine dinucleotide biosynthesis protein MobB
VSAVACAVVGPSGAGKTLLIEQLVPVLCAAGLTVGYGKHAPHGFDMDRSGSDSDRVRRAGAGEIVLAGGSQVSHLKQLPDGQAPQTALVEMMAGCDLVLLEGFSAGGAPKIRVRAAGQDKREVAPPILLDLVRRGAAWEHQAIQAAADAVLRLVRETVPPPVSVVVDGRDVPVEGFAARVVASTVLGLTGALRGVEDPRAVTVSVRSPMAARQGRHSARSSLDDGDRRSAAVGRVQSVEHVRD